LAFLDGVRRGEPHPLGIDQHTRQQARLGSIGGLAATVARVCIEPIPQGGPGLGIDQRRVLRGLGPGDFVIPSRTRGDVASADRAD
jgi:hypothetical protein